MKGVGVNRWRSVFAFVVLVVAVVVLGASGSSDKAEKVGASNSGSGGSSAQSFKVGDEVKLGDWTVTVAAVNDPQPSDNQFLKPKAGTRWVGVDTEVKNLSKSPQTVSSIACFKLQDAKNQQYTLALTGLTPAPPDGAVDPNGAVRGLLTYEVPQDATGLKLKFSCDLFSSGSATIALS